MSRNMGRNTISPEQDFSVWNTDRLENYKTSLEALNDRRDRNTISRISQILENKKKDSTLNAEKLESEIYCIINETFLGSVTEDTSSYAAGLVNLGTILENNGYLKLPPSQSIFGENKENRVYRKGEEVIDIDITDGSIIFLNLIEDIGGLMPKERQEDIRKRYPTLGHDTIMYSGIGDMYKNYIAKIHKHINTNKLTNVKAIVDLLREILA